MALADIGVAALAVILIVLGIRGTYVSVWNSLFPNYAIQMAAPINTTGTQAGGGAGGYFGTPSSPAPSNAAPSRSAPSSTPYMGNNPLPGYHGSQF